MARKSKKQIAQSAALDMLVDLIGYYREELKLVTAQGNPNHARYMVEAGLRLISFIDEVTTSDKSPSPKHTSPAVIDADKLKTAFGKLVVSQAAQKTHTPTTGSVSDAQSGAISDDVP